LTQDELARKVGTTQPVISRLESGEQLPTVTIYFRYVIIFFSLNLFVSKLRKEKPHDKRAK
jgi:transcriptional regulator with XRE-family HTH domain